uniref:Helicase ATP-binding domain-containing protein n=1 Tax=Heterorhabditis bacteriophora TaxID=37862 RepID=A0A1I7WPC8_HETBA
MTAEEIALLNKFLHRTVDMMRNESLDVSKQQMDPKSPLHSPTRFVEGFGLNGISTTFKNPGICTSFITYGTVSYFNIKILLQIITKLRNTEYMKRCVGYFLNNSNLSRPTNMIAQSQSGTGKTAAFVLTMLSRLNSENRWPQCLCLAPTYELAIQIGEVLTKMARFMPDVKVHYAVKGIKRCQSFYIAIICTLILKVDKFWNYIFDILDLFIYKYFEKLFCFY